MLFRSVFLSPEKILLRRGKAIKRGHVIYVYVPSKGTRDAQPRSPNSSEMSLLLFPQSCQQFKGSRVFFGLPGGTGEKRFQLCVNYLLPLPLEVLQEISWDAQQGVNGKCPSGLRQVLLHVAGDQLLFFTVGMKPLKTSLLSGEAGCPAQVLLGHHFIVSTCSG